MSLALHRPDPVLAVGLRDGAILLFCVQNSTVIRRLSIASLAITSLAFASSTIIAQHADNTITAHTALLQHRSPLGFKSASKSWAVSPFGVLYTQLTDPGPIISVDVLTGRQLSRSVESYASPRLAFVDQTDICGLVVTSRDTIASYSVRL